MKLTTERTDLLGKYLQEDVNRAKALLNLSPEEATEKINADGYDFSVDEIIEFGENLKAASAEGELSEESLNDVAGGLVITTAAAAVYVSCITLGLGVGYAAGKHW